jgi:hypothetical protein
VSAAIPSQILESSFNGLERFDIEDWVESHRIEDLTLDFKTAPKNFKDRDERKMLARAISGFANVSGGLIVWGVRAARNKEDIDAAQAVDPINDPVRFLSNLTLYSGLATTPRVPGVVHRMIEGVGCAVTLVPKGEGGPTWLVTATGGTSRVPEAASIKWSILRSRTRSVGEVDLSW